MWSDYARNFPGFRDGDIQLGFLDVHFGGSTPPTYEFSLGHQDRARRRHTLNIIRFYRYNILVILIWGKRW